MKQTRPVLHARDHMQGGADPIPGLLPPSGTVERGILATIPGAYYKVPETTGDWRDSSGAGRDATYNGAYAPTRGVAGLLDEGDGSRCVTVNGPAPAAALSDSAIGSVSDPFFDFSGAHPFTVSALIRPAALPTGTFSMGVLGNTSLATSGGITGWGLFLLSANFDPDGTHVAGRPAFRRAVTPGGATGEGDAVAYSTTPLTAGVWVRLTGVYDGSTVGLYLDAAPTAGFHSRYGSTNPTLPTSSTFRFGAAEAGEGFGGTYAPFQGDLDSIIVWDRALSLAEIASIIDAGAGQGGWVLGLDDTGTPVWQPPGVEVTHGGGTPDPAPADSSSSPFAGTPTSSSGWHLQAHTETAVLYDSTPARFDVPSRKWVRVPFNTVRIQRSWEPTVGGPTVKSAWLPDDRSLTDAARDGILHITSGMVFGSAGHTITGYYAIEYPVLDYLGLPDFTGGGITAPDAYTRSARILNLSTGVVLRITPGSTQRRFVEWEFLDDAGGMPVSVLYNGDSPYPIYPAWPARPLTLPQPYPRLSPTDSLGYYLTPAGNPGFHFGNFDLAQNLVAGDNLCLQAWQDSPWLIRFTTDHFPNYQPQAYTEQWLARPFLSVQYSYDPETVNHTTGKLL